jgi:hypothetical protein
MKHFVTFLLPGFICAETSEREIENWDIEKAKEYYEECTYIKPYGFYFTTYERTDIDWGPKEIAHSGTYFINGTVKTLEEVKAENNPRNEILIDNMRINKWDKIVTTQSGFTQPFLEDDKNITFT